MGICAYCNQDKGLTKEHVIPNWFSQIDTSPNDFSFLEKSPKKFVPDIVIKDVCNDCNNVHLSKMDQYGRKLYEEYFKYPVYANDIIEFEYDYNLLVKWLVKCAYNSARIHNTDLEILKDYAQDIISDEKLSEEIIVFCSFLPSSKMDAGNDPVPALRADNEDDVFHPNWFRVGIYRVPHFDSIDYCFRTVIIHSYAFYLAIPKKEFSSIKGKRELLIQLSGNLIFGQRLPSGGKAQFIASGINAAKSIMSHMASNPLTYKIVKDDFSSIVQENNFDLIVHDIHRNDIESGNTEEIEVFFLTLKNSRENALLYMQKIEFCINGYDSDSRELWEISDVIKYLGNLNKIFPYWLFYLHPESSWLKVLFVCLGNNKGRRKTENGRVAIELDVGTLVRHTKRWFRSLNELCHKMCVGETLNRKMSKSLNLLIKEMDLE